MLGKAFLAVLAIFLLLGAFATPIMDGIRTWRTSDVTENFLVATGAGVTTANVTLADELYQYAPAQVQSISSNITGESPVATTYTQATNSLLVSALDANDNRTLGVRYYAETEDAVMQAIGPFLAILIIGFLLLMIVWGMFSKTRGH